ncbi:MAG TPA: aspartate aminotransferase family protein [Dehalococcoidia bacterium]|jgi:adenosylmethionine-8-amino-7-oxononanoate aminotransferase|nr:aspartate aminotransferase family protein [Dehalococcoidia bacterium]
MKSSQADRLVSIAKEYLWPAFARDASFFGRPVSMVSSGEGRHIIDIFGNRLLDPNSCGGAVPLGFNLPELMEAVSAQMKKIMNTTPSLFVPTEPLPLLAEKIASISPGNLKYTIFGSNGTDANDAAIKIARHYWKIMGKGSKYKVIHRYPGDYHGMSLSTASASGHNFRRAPFEPLMAGFIAFHSPYCYRCPYRMTYPECDLYCAEEFRQVIEFEDPSTIACFIGESTNTGLGIVPPPPGYMKKIRQLCDEYEILMITDEVITGFGKTGFWFECEKEGFVPDMITMGKGISWGCGPLAGTHVKDDIAQVFTGPNVLQHGYTFGGMGYLAAAGLAGIEYVEKHNLLARATEIGEIMSRELGAIKEKSKVIGDVRVNGVLAGVEFVKDKTTKERFADRAAVADLVVKVGIDNGVLLPCSTWYGDIIMLMVQLTMTDEELSQVFTAIERAAAEVEKKFL